MGLGFWCCRNLFPVATNAVSLPIFVKTILLPIIIVIYNRANAFLHPQIACLVVINLAFVLRLTVYVFKDALPRVVYSDICCAVVVFAPWSIQILYKSLWCCLKWKCFHVHRDQGTQSNHHHSANLRQSTTIHKKHAAFLLLYYLFLKSSSAPERPELPDPIKGRWKTVQCSSWSGLVVAEQHRAQSSKVLSTFAYSRNRRVGYNLIVANTPMKTLLTVGLLLGAIAIPNSAHANPYPRNGAIGCAPGYLRYSSWCVPKKASGTYYRGRDIGCAPGYRVYSDQCVAKQ